MADLLPPLPSTDPAQCWVLLDQWLTIHEETLEKEWRLHPRRYAAARGLLMELSDRAHTARLELRALEGQRFVELREHGLEAHTLKMTDEVTKRCVDFDPAVVAARRHVLTLVGAVALAEGCVRALEMKERSLKYLTMRLTETGTLDPDVQAALQHHTTLQHENPLTGLFDD